MTSTLSIVTDPRLNKTTIPTTTFINHFPSNNENSIIRPYTIQEFEQSLEIPDLFKRRFGLTVAEYRSVIDPLQLRDNMLADPNNFVEELYEDLLEEGQLYDRTTDLPPVPPQPIQRPKQTAPKKKSKRFERTICTKCKKPEYDHVLWRRGIEESYDACYCKGGPHPQAEKPASLPEKPLTPEPTLSDTTASSMPSLMSISTDSTIPITTPSQTPLPTYASIAKKATQEKQPLPTPQTHPTLTPDQRCIILNDRIISLLQQHREATRILEQKFHQNVETSVIGKLCSEAVIKCIDDQIQDNVKERFTSKKNEDLNTFVSPFQPSIPKHPLSSNPTTRPFKVNKKFTMTKCNQCKRTGHIKKDCKNFTCGFCHRAAPGHIPSFCDKYVCNYCKKHAPGHFFKECPQRHEDEAAADRDYWNHEDYANWDDDYDYEVIDRN